MSLCLEHKLLVSYRTPPHFSCCHSRIARSQPLSLTLILCCTGKAAKMAFPSLITAAPSCFPPSQCPHLSWAVALVQPLLGTGGSRAILPARFLVKTPFFDNSQSKGMTAPAPCQLLSRSCLEANCMCGSQCEDRKRLEFRPSWKEEEESPGTVSGPTQDGCSSRGRLRSLSPGCSCRNAWAFSSWSMKQVNDKNTPL